MKNLPRLQMFDYTIPRYLFIETYQPSSDAMREMQLKVRNVENLAAYKAKRNLAGRT